MTIKTRRLFVITACVLVFAGAVANLSRAQDDRLLLQGFDKTIADHANTLITEGRKIFRFDTFGSEDFWGGKLRLHEAIAGTANGGVGLGLSPKNALATGLKVDAEMLPASLVADVIGGRVNLDDPAVTLSLLKLNAVIGITGFFSADGKIVGVGIQCALCHSIVDQSFSTAQIPAGSIGARLDGWPNRDVNVGAIIALAPTVKPFADLLEVDEATVRRVVLAWGPGKFDAELFLDGKGFRPDGKTAATLMPAAFGLAGVNLSTYTGWGSVTHWNAFVANLEMQGKGTFWDPRLNDATKFPIAAKNNFGNKRNTPDLTTSKLAALHVYQLNIPAPAQDAQPFDFRNRRGEILFNGKAKCATCHVPPLYTEPGWNMHTAAEIGIDDFQASRSPDNRYRTTPLRGMIAKRKGGYYHDGRFAKLRDVINHYDQHLNLGLTKEEKRDLSKFVGSL